MELWALIGRTGAQERETRGGSKVIVTNKTIAAGKLLAFHKWAFQELGTLRRTLIQRAGPPDKTKRPNNHLTPTLSANPAARDELLRIFHALPDAA